MPALKWLRLLLNHIPDRYEHPLRYYGYDSNRARGARRLAPQHNHAPLVKVIDDLPVGRPRKTHSTRLIQRVYEIDPLECPNCGATMRIISLINDADVVKRILRHLKVWDPISPAGPDPPWPDGETLPITYHPVRDIAPAPVPMSALGQATPKTA
jgi:hypothetical protein